MSICRLNLLALLLLSVAGCQDSSKRDAKYQEVLDRQERKYDEQSERLDKLLDKWDEQAIRQDAILSAQEKQLGIGK